MVVTWEANSVRYVQFKIIYPFMLKNVHDKSRQYQLFLQRTGEASNDKERNKLRNRNARSNRKITAIYPYIANLLSACKFWCDQKIKHITKIDFPLLHIIGFHYCKSFKTFIVCALFILWILFYACFSVLFKTA